MELIMEASKLVTFIYFGYLISDIAISLSSIIDLPMYRNYNCEYGISALAYITTRAARNLRITLIALCVFIWTFDISFKYYILAALVIVAILLNDSIGRALGYLVILIECKIMKRIAKENPNFKIVENPRYLIENEMSMGALFYVCYIILNLPEYSVFILSISCVMGCLLIAVWIGTAILFFHQYYNN